MEILHFSLRWQHPALSASMNSYTEVHVHKSNKVTQQMLHHTIGSDLPR